MKYSRATVGRMQLDDYVRIVPQIYGKHDRHRSIWDVWCHTLHHGAAVAERIRKEVQGIPVPAVIQATKTGMLYVFDRVKGQPLFPITEKPVPASKVPGAKLLGPCDCFEQESDRRGKAAKRADLKALHRFSKSVRSRKPSSIDEWQAMFGAIFEKNIERLSPTEIGFHLLEELGEVSDAMARMYSYVESNFRLGEPNWRQARLEDQIADALSWLFALVRKLNAMKFSNRELKHRDQAERTAQVTLSEIIWRRYGSDDLGAFRCPSCNSQVCSCPLVFVPGTHSVNDLLQRFKPRGIF